MGSDARILIGEQHMCESCGAAFNFSFADGRDAMTTNDSFMRVEIKWQCPECGHQNVLIPFIGWPYSPARSIDVADFVKVATMVSDIFQDT